MSEGKVIGVGSTSRDKKLIDYGAGSFSVGYDDQGMVAFQVYDADGEVVVRIEVDPASARAAGIELIQVANEVDRMNKEIEG